MKKKASVSKEVIRVAIIGAGRGGTALLNIMHDLPDIEVVAVVDEKSDAPGMLLAAQRGIPTEVGLAGIGDVFRKAERAVDVLIDVTGDPDLHSRLLEFKPPYTRLISGAAAKFIWELIRAVRERDEWKQRYEEEAASHLPKEAESAQIIFGSNPLMQQVRNLIEQVAPTPTTVLLIGETGTGKELMAGMIHSKSDRKNKPFVKINCTAFSPTLLESELFGHVKGAFTGALTDKRGLLEEGDGGTIFLDEIGDISLDMQVKLLRFLQFGELRPVGSTKTKIVDARVIAATNRPLQKLIKKGKFRADLYYRLNAFRIDLPPLRKRKEDLEQLAHHFLLKARHRLNKKSVLGFSTEALDCILSYSYPGNLREMQSIIERAVILCRGEEIKPEHLPVNMQSAEPFSPLPSGKFKEKKAAWIAQFEREFICKCLRKTAGNVSRAAEEAGLPRKSFYRLMNKYGIKRKDFK